MLSRLTNIARSAAKSSNKGSTSTKLASSRLIAKDLQRDKELREIKANDPAEETPNLRTNEEMPKDRYTNNNASVPNKQTKANTSKMAPGQS